MENIIEPNDNFEFSNLTLANPTGIQGGAYFTKIQYFNKPLYIQTPKSLTKQGFVKIGKKIYCDLMFDNNDEKFIHWIENLETTCQKLIYEKGDTWFQSKLELNDIENAFASPLRVYKSGKYYLVRVNVKTNYSTNIPNIKIYNESEIPLTIDDINSNTNIISILEVQGIKFTSRNFQIEIELKQTMVLSTEIIFDNCLIKTSNQAKKKEEIVNNNNTNVENENVILSIKEEKKEEEKREEEKRKEEEKNIIDIEENQKNDDDEEEQKEQQKEQQNEQQNEQQIEKESEKEMEVEKNREEQKKEKESSLEVLEDFLEEIDKKEEIDNFDSLKEFDLNASLDTLETITLKNPNQVYYEIYKEARNKAKNAKKEAIIAFLEAKNIKKTYMLNDLEDSDESDMDNISEYSN